MVHHGIGSSAKLRRLTPAERWCYVAGVLAIASQSPLRGALLIAENIPANEDDVAQVAGVSGTVAAGAVQKLRGYGMLVKDAEGCEWVRDWDEWQPAPPKPSDLPEATRDRKRKSRAKQTRDNSVTGGVTSRDVSRDPSREVEVEVEEPPLTPPAGGQKEEKPIELPHGLSGFLVPVAEALRHVAAGKNGAFEPTDAAVAKSLRDFPNKDFLPEAADFEHYWLHGAGAARPMKDVVQTWRNRLRTRLDVVRKTPAAGTTPGNGHRQPIDVDEDLQRRLREAEL